jgi:hypothetical protein
VFRSVFPYGHKFEREYDSGTKAGSDVQPLIGLVSLNVSGVKIM